MLRAIHRRRETFGSISVGLFRSVSLGLSISVRVCELPESILTHHLGF